MAVPRVTLTVPTEGGGRDVVLTHPDRVVWPRDGITKRELAEYLIAVRDPFLRANGGRPVTLQRFPDGVASAGFFSKSPPAGMSPYAQTAVVTYASGRRHPQLVITEIATAVWAAQMNTVVFHPWASRADDTERPDQLRFDLDPQPGTDFADAARVAPVLRDVLAEAGLQAWPKTSGGRGLHVFCAIVPEHDFVDVRHAVIAAARELARRMPDAVTVDWWKSERGRRVFVDFNQATRDRTTAGAYSPRAAPGAPVSTPLRWEELASTSVDPASFTVRTVPRRLAEDGDPWAAFDEHAGRLDMLLRWWQRDVADGLGELPYPPDFPKMPGEPPRVDPSRARPRG